MKKDGTKRNSVFFGSVKILVFAAFLCAISGVMKLIAPSGDVWRISLENFPIILSGITMGPIVGGMVGIIADLLGCIFRGYAINPLITMASMFVGVISGFVYKYTKHSKIAIILSSFTAHIIANLFIKTIVLSYMYGMKLIILFAERGITYFLTALVECILLTILLNNKTIRSQLKDVVGYEL